MQDYPNEMQNLPSEEEKEQSPVPQTFMSRAYLLPLEKGLYGLYRDILMEDPETKQREKLGKPIGPIRVLRQIRQGEDQRLVRIRTVHPKTGQTLELVEHS